MLWAWYQSTILAEYTSNQVVNKKNQSTVSLLLFESKVILDSKIHPKSSWSYVKSKDKNPADVTSPLVDGNIISNDLEKAELLNSYFASVFVQSQMMGSSIIYNICQTDVIKDFDVKRIYILRIIEKMNIF